MRPAVFASTILAMVVFVASGMAPSRAESLSSTYTESTKPVEQSILGRRFRVTEAYFRRPIDRVSRDMGLDGAMMMFATFPDLLPYAKERAWMYEPPSLFLLVVHFSLWGIKKGTGLWEPYFTPEFLATCTEFRYHLMQCPHPWSQLDEVYVKVDGDRKYAWRCIKAGVLPGSNCQGSFLRWSQKIGQVAKVYSAG